MDGVGWDKTKWEKKMGENVIKMGEKNAKVDENKTSCAIRRQKLKLGIAKIKLPWGLPPG
jgi:hypothetical protein